MARWTEVREWEPGRGYVTRIHRTATRKRTTLRTHQLQPLTGWTAETAPSEFRRAAPPMAPIELPRGRRDVPCIGTDPQGDPNLLRDVPVTVRVLEPLTIMAAIDRATAAPIGRKESKQLTLNAFATDRFRWEAFGEPDEDPRRSFPVLFGYEMTQARRLRSGGIGDVATVVEEAVQRAREERAHRALIVALDHMAEGIVPADPVGEIRSVTRWQWHLDRMRRWQVDCRKALTRWISTYRTPVAPMVRPPWQRPVFFAAIEQGTGDAYLQEADAYAEQCAQRFARALMVKAEAESMRWWDAAGTEHWISATD